MLHCQTLIAAALIDDMICYAAPREPIQLRILLAAIDQTAKRPRPDWAILTVSVGTTVFGH